ncbi:hypothetical protein J2X32_003616 [Rheinheimera pacifica]|uniref:hypothetical protein n=1 Tax=Rheinheimera pacifica TaxID=173990 RepID=UPI000CC15B43|nr:hypothetical protein [Rheinheimera pacifica]MDR6984960.1 hypothetical protein [Rheinheimera pacifica]PKM18059.1 MAG: hypothetical protein CVV11_18355 [Gammaproteobacteria bacterium HGW-Gammaproteobacteria-15]
MTITNVLFRLMLVATLVFSVVACEKNNAEEAGEKIDEIATDVGNKVEDLCEDVKDKADAKDKDC